MMAAAVVTAATCAQDEKVQQQITASRSIGEHFIYVYLYITQNTPILVHTNSNSSNKQIIPFLQTVESTANSARSPPKPTESFWE